MFRKLLQVICLFLPTLAFAQAPKHEGRRFTLVVDSLTVAKVKPNGQPWDGGTVNYLNPDPLVIVSRVDADTLNKLNKVRNEYYPLQRQQQQFSDGMARGLERPNLNRGRVPEPKPLTPAQEKRLNELAAELQELEHAHRRHTNVAHDTLEATFNERTLAIKSGDRIRLDVWDKDVLVDDPMGHTVLTITPAMLQQGEVVLKFGSVTTCKIRFVAE